jgi:hypothetical protein
MATEWSEDWLRKNAPMFNAYDWYVKHAPERGSMAQAYTLRIRTWRELAEYYKYWIHKVESYLFYSIIAGVVAVFSFVQILITKNISWVIIATVTAVIAGFYYRHAFGRYGNLAKLENVPCVTPPRNVFEQAKRSGVDLGGKPRFGSKPVGD